MERITYRITLDAYKNGIQRVLQGFETADNMARRIAINLTSGGDTFELPSSNLVAMMYVTVPGTDAISINNCEIVNDTIIYDVLPIIKEGITEMQLKLIETRPDGAKKVLAYPKFAVEVTESNMNDTGAMQTTTFTALEDAVAKAEATYSSRLVRIEIDEGCVFKAYYADGTVYENDYLHEALYNGNALLSESWAKGGTGVRPDEDTNNSMYFSNVSRSASADASMITEDARGLLEEAMLHSTFTAFKVDFFNGELEYVTGNYTFDINELSGDLEVVGSADVEFEDVVEESVNAFMNDKTKEIDDALDGFNDELAEIDESIKVIENDLKDLKDKEVENFATTTSKDLQNSKAGGLKVLNVFGKSEQGENPSPSNQQSIANANAKCKVTGNNLINQECTPVGSDLDKKHFLKAGSYTVSRDASENGKNWYIGMWDADGNCITQTATHLSGWNVSGSGEYYYGAASSTSVVFELKEDCYVGFYALNGSGKTYLMLNKGKEALPYEPCTEQTLTIDRVLRGIPVTDSELANYTDENGQMWCADYGDVERKVWVQKTGVATLPKTGWSFNRDSSSYIEMASWNFSVGQATMDQVVMSDYFAQNDDNKITVTKKDVYVRLPKSGIATSNEASTWLSNHDVIIHFALATPIETPMTDEEVIALHSIKTYNGVTHITTENVPEATLEVEYGTSEVGAMALENSNILIVNELLKEKVENAIDEINNALPYSIVIDDEAETINFIDREVGSIGGSGTGGGASTFTGFAGAGFHNSIYRGQYLGTSVTEAQYKAIADGTFNDLYIGDYWTINGVNWRIASFDYYLNTGNVECTTHHVVIVPDKCLYNYQMNSSNTTNGGYVGSNMYTQGLEQAKTLIKGAFSGHVLSKKVYLNNTVSGGKPSAGAWFDSEVDLMCEEMVYGGAIFHSVSDGSTITANFRVEKSQLPLFAHEHSRISNKESWWLRDVTNSTNFAAVPHAGNAGSMDASKSDVGVRPAFCIKG